MEHSVRHPADRGSREEARHIRRCRVVSEIDCSISAILIRKDQIKSKTLEIDIYALELLFERLCCHHNVANGENRMEGRDEQ